ncbi:MAG: LuxR family transcriptional regulator [Novosphingobium sp.]
MAVTPTDETNLLLPLFEGIFEMPVWETFLRRLLQRTGAQRIRLTVHNSAAPGQPALRRRVTSDRFSAGEDPGEPGPLDPAVYAALRPNRVYSLAEMRDFDSTAARAAQDGVLKKAGIGDARLIRIAGRGDLNAWLVLLHERETFSAAESALLTSLAPAITAALALLATIGAMRLRTEAAEGSLAMLGIGQAVLDAEAHVLVADPLAQQTLSHQPNVSDPATVKACAELATAAPETRRVVRSDNGLGRDLLLRPIHRNADAPPHPAVAVATFRTEQREDQTRGAQIIASTLGLSAREAALAEALSRGIPLIEAGQALSLTAETTRNYSKRIYAKTGTAGQADLVRLVLTGLAPLA